jgi:D-sedoheptulose 7-phosphate isomerase
MADPTPHLDALIARHPDLLACRPGLLAAFGLLRDTFAGGGKLLLCGHGGSAADCEHFAGELLKGFALPRPLAPSDRALLPPDLGAALQGGLPAIPLPSLLSAPSAFANDVDPSAAFAQGVWALGRPGDALAALTTSGRSRGVRLALTAARARGLRRLVLTGQDGADLHAEADVVVVVPAREPWAVQELHLPVYHALARMLEEAFFG